MKSTLSFIAALFSFITVCSAQANTRLSNLVAPTKVNVDLLPNGNGKRNFGADTMRWKNGFFDASVYAYGTGSNYGIYGHSHNGDGVAGISDSSFAVYGNGYIGTIGYGTYSGAWGDGGTYGLVGFGEAIGVWGKGPTYAGYFAGDVYTSGTYLGSDKNLKKNIREFINGVDIINKLKPLQFEYRNDGNYLKMNLPGGNHYGLIAQDVEPILPNLIKQTEFNPYMTRPDEKNNDMDAKGEMINFKAVNYTELIPIIIKAVQELDKKNTALAQENALLKSQMATLQQQVDQFSKINNGTDITNASLNQNYPNPFKGSTVISFNIPKASKNASVTVSETGTGKTIKTIAVSVNDNQLTLNAGSLSAGSYLYTLYVDGKKIDSKQMVVNR